jgi:hypothetical protein
MFGNQILVPKLCKYIKSGHKFGHHAVIIVIVFVIVVVVVAIVLVATAAMF